MLDNEIIDQIDALTEDEYNELNMNVQDEASLEEYTRKLAQLEMEKRILEQQHARRISSVDRKIEMLKYFSGESAMLFFQRVLARQKGKSYDTPYMRISSRKTAGYVKIDDADLILKKAFEFGINHQEIQKTSVDSIALKKLIKYSHGRLYTPAGEVIENPEQYGLSIVDEKETISFSLPKE